MLSSSMLTALQWHVAVTVMAGLPCTKQTPAWPVREAILNPSISFVPSCGPPKRGHFHVRNVIAMKYFKLILPLLSLAAAIFLVQRGGLA